MNKKIFLVIFLIFLSPFLFFLFSLFLILFPIIFADMPLDISCSSKEQKCEVYSIKFYQPFLYIFVAKKIEKNDPEKSQEIKSFKTNVSSFGFIASIDKTYCA